VALGINHLVEGLLPALSSVTPVDAEIDGLSSSVNDDHSITVLQRPARETVFHGKMQTGLSFRYEGKSSMATGVVWNKTGCNRCLSHLLLLRAFPSVWVSEDEVDVILNCLPEDKSIGICIFDIVRSSLEKVREKIGEDFDDCLVEW